jgi:phosphotransferase system HPr (HPr) family protein
MIMPSQEHQASLEFDLQWSFESPNVSYFTRTARKFVSAIAISGGEETADAKVLMDVFMLCLGKGRHIKVSASGPDADAAIEALRNALSMDEEAISDEVYQRSARGRWLPKP